MEDNSCNIRFMKPIICKEWGRDLSSREGHLYLKIACNNDCSLAVALK